VRGAVGLDQLVGTAPVVTALLAAGVVAVFWEILGGRGSLEKIRHGFLDILAVPAGTFALLTGIWNLHLGTTLPINGYLLLLGGLVLWTKVLHDLPWPALIALACGIGAGVGSWLLLGSVLPWWASAILGLVVFAIVYVPLAIVKGLLNLAALLFAPRFVMLILGAVLVAQGILVDRGSSLSAIW
jgi:hypothetical protein